MLVISLWKYVLILWSIELYYFVYNSNNKSITNVFDHVNDSIFLLKIFSIKQRNNKNKLSFTKTQNEPRYHSLINSRRNRRFHRRVPNELGFSPVYERRAWRISQFRRARNREPR